MPVFVSIGGCYSNGADKLADVPHVITSKENPLRAESSRSPYYHQNMETLRHDAAMRERPGGHIYAAIKDNMRFGGN